MSVTAIEGVVENGSIRLPEHISLPEHTKVYIVVPDVQAAGPPRIHTPRLAHREDAKYFRKQVTEVRKDAGV